MKKSDFTVIHVIEVVDALNRAGGKAGQTSVAKLAKVTPPRAKSKLISAAKQGLLFPYKDAYRPNVQRVCYSLTDTGQKVLETIHAHTESTIWGLTGE